MNQIDSILRNYKTHLDKSLVSRINEIESTLIDTADEIIRIQIKGKKKKLRDRKAQDKLSNLFEKYGYMNLKSSIDRNEKIFYNSDSSKNWQIIKTSFPGLFGKDAYIEFYHFKNNWMNENSIGRNFNSFQKSLYLRNSSFESIRFETQFGPARRFILDLEVNEENIPIPYWLDCGKKYFPQHSPPTIHQKDETMFSVVHQATDENTFLGLVTREDESFESISQKLINPLLKGTKYLFEIDLAKSEEYQSRTLMSDESVSFNNSITFQIFTGTEFCDLGNSIFITQPVEFANWVTYSFEFVPPKNIEFLTLLVAPNSDKFKNGNILIDNFRITKI